MQNKLLNWRERFKIIEFGRTTYPHEVHILFADLENLVAQLLESQKAEIIAGVDELKITENFKPISDKYAGANDRKWAYNRAIDDVLSQLKDL